MDQLEILPDPSFVSVDPVASIFSRVTRALDCPWEVLLRGTGVGVSALRQWKSGRRRPETAAVLSQVARNLRSHAIRLCGYADTLDNLAARYAEVPRPPKGPRSTLKAREETTPSAREEARSSIRDAFEEYVRGLGDRPVPGFGKPWADMTGREKNEAAAKYRAKP